MHKGAAALLWGEPAASMRASCFCWRAACSPAWGDPPPPRLALGGNGKGGLNSLLPQAISGTLAGATRIAQHGWNGTVFMSGSEQPVCAHPTASGNGSALASSAE